MTSPVEENPDISPQRLVEAVGHHFPDLLKAPVIDENPPGRRAQTAVVLHTPEGPVLAKVSFVEGEIRDRFFTRLDEHRRLEAAGAPFPSVLHVAESSILDGYPLVLTSHAGQSADIFFQTCTPDERLGIIRRIGAAMKAMHSITFSEFSVPAEGTTQLAPTWYDVFTHNFAATQERLNTYLEKRKAGDDSLGDTDFINQAINKVARRMSQHKDILQAVEPAATHGDLHYPKVFIKPDGSIEFRDPDESKRADPLRDWTKAYWYFLESPNETAHLEEPTARKLQELNAQALGGGYGTLPEHFTERQEVSEGTELLEKLMYWLIERRKASPERRNPFLSAYKERLIAWTNNSYPNPELMGILIAASQTTENTPPSRGPSQTPFDIRTTPPQRGARLRRN